MSLLRRARQRASELLFGDPFDGAPFPPDPLIDVDGRTACLRVLADYLGELIFRRPGKLDPASGETATERFRFRPEDIYVEWPDNEDKMQFPSAVLLSGDAPADYASIGLTPHAEEDTRNVYGRGTQLWWQSENTEMVQLEVWCDTRAERRAVKAGLELALVPVQQMFGIRFRVPGYFDQVVCYALMSSRVYDEPDGARGRRRVRFTLEQRFNQVALARELPVLRSYAEVELGGAVDTTAPAPVAPARLDPRQPANVEVEDPRITRDPC